jgi:hypothetical protein
VGKGNAYDRRLPQTSFFLREHLLFFFSNVQVGFLVSMSFPQLFFGKDYKSARCLFFVGTAGYIHRPPTIQLPCTPRTASIPTPLVIAKLFKSGGLRLFVSSPLISSIPLSL